MTVPAPAASRTSEPIQKAVPYIRRRPVARRRPSQRTDRLQAFCQQCPPRLLALSEALTRQNLAVSGVRASTAARSFAAHKPKGRPREDADEVAAQAAARWLSGSLKSRLLSR